MAKAKCCDLCGVLYLPYNVKNDAKNPSGFKLLNMDEDGRYFSHKETDACPKCMNSIIDHIKFLKMSNGSNGI